MKTEKKENGLGNNMASYKKKQKDTIAAGGGGVIMQGMGVTAS